VMALVMKSGLRVVVGGLAIGALGAFFAVRVLKSLLVGVSGFDPVSIFAAIVLMTLTALAAAFLPARRAASIEPMEALRSE
jgi:putative ABC transport system permease protein